MMLYRGFKIITIKYLQNTLLVANIRQAHYDRKMWDDPESLNPKRYFDDNGRFQQSLIKTFIFGSGKY